MAAIEYGVALFILCVIFAISLIKIRQQNEPNCRHCLSLRTLIVIFVAYVPDHVPLVAINNEIPPLFFFGARWNSMYASISLINVISVENEDTPDCFSEWILYPTAWFLACTADVFVLFCFVEIASSRLEFLTEKTGYRALWIMNHPLSLV